MADIPTLPPVNNQQTTQVSVTQVEGNFNQIQTNFNTITATLNALNSEISGGGVKFDEIFIGGISVLENVGTAMNGRNSDTSVLLRDVPSGAQLRVVGQSIIPANATVDTLAAARPAVEGLNGVGGTLTLVWNANADSSTEGNRYDVIFQVLAPVTNAVLATSVVTFTFTNSRDDGTLCYYGVEDNIIASTLDLTTNFFTKNRFNGVFNIPSIAAPAYLWMLYPAVQDHPQQVFIGALVGGEDQSERFFMQFGVRTIGGVQYSAMRSIRRLTTAGDLSGRIFIVQRRIF